MKKLVSESLNEGYSDQVNTDMIQRELNILRKMAERVNKEYDDVFSSMVLKTINKIENEIKL